MRRPLTFPGVAHPTAIGTVGVAMFERCEIGVGCVRHAVRLDLVQIAGEGRT